MNISDIRTKVYAQNERSCLVMRSAQVSTPDEAVSTLVDAEQKEPRFSTLTDPLIQALVSKLPPPSSTWSIDDRANWLKALARYSISSTGPKKAKLPTRKLRKQSRRRLY